MMTLGVQRKKKKKKKKWHFTFVPEDTLKYDSQKINKNNAEAECIALFSHSAITKVIIQRDNKLPRCIISVSGKARDTSNDWIAFHRLTLSLWKTCKPKHS